MNLYVYRPELGSLGEEHEWKEATPTEALQYALTCQTCKRTPGRVRMVGDKVVGDALGWMEVESSPCPDCVDGIPRWAIETVAKAIYEQTMERSLPDWENWPSRYADDWRDSTRAGLVALRDREET